MLLLVGHKGSTSTVADYAVEPVTDVTSAISRLQEGSELSGMVRIACKMPGLLVSYCAVPEPSGGTQATATITIAGAWTQGGSWGLDLDDHHFEVPIYASDTVTTAAANLVAVVGAEYDVFCTASQSSGVVTLTVRNKGARGNDHTIYVDKTNLPSGATVTVAGGTALSNGAVPFASGAGTDTIATILAATAAARYDYTAWAMNEAANVDDIAAQTASKAGPFGPGPENVIVGFHGTLSAAGTRSQVMNQQLCQLVWLEAIVHPSKLAAAMGAMRSVVEASPVTELGNPNARHDFTALFGIPPHRKPEHSPSRSQTDTALNTGVTPIITRNSQAVVLRSITSRSLNGSLPDYSTLDTGDAVVPQRVREDNDVWWTTEHAPNNPYCGPDLPSGDLPPEGLSTPKLVLTRVNGRLEELKRLNLIANDNAAAIAEYNTTLKCIVVNIPCKVTKQNHQYATVIRQIAG
jgi:phage tail sheath gpL-like